MVQRIVSFKISSELLKLLDRYARRKRMTRSEVIREAIVRLLRSEGYSVDPSIVHSEPMRQGFEVRVD